MNKRIKKLAKESGIEFVKVTEAWIAVDEDIERFYQMAYEQGIKQGMLIERAINVFKMTLDKEQA